MKKFILTTLPALFVLGAILVIGSGCPGSAVDEPAPPVAVCNTSTTPFKTLYSGLKANTSAYQELNLIDLTTREYVFELTGGDTKLCSIGYKAEPGIPSGTYKMSLIDNGTVLFTGNLSFSATGMSYVGITPVQLQLNRPYMLRREALNYAGNLANTVGNLLAVPTGAALTLPIVGTNIKIIQTSFYGVNGTGGPFNNKYLPNIDFGTQP
jgi:hypothetical protein